MAKSRDDLYELIDPYLWGQLNEADSALVNAQLQDPEFAAELAFRRSLIAASRKAGREDLRAELAALSPEKPAQIRPLRPGRKGVWYAVAAVVALTLAFWGIQSTQSPPPQALFAEHFSPFPNVEQVITRNQVISEDVRTQAYAQYELEHYAEAIAFFDQLLTAEPENLSHQFYRAISQLGLAQAAAAQEALERVSQSDTSRYAVPALWFLALAHLQQGHWTEADLHLNQILQDPSHHYYREAQALQAEMP